MAAKILQFPVSRITRSAAIDWTALERTRCRCYPQIPKVALRIIRNVVESSPASRIFRTGNWRAEVCSSDSDLKYPIVPAMIRTHEDVLDLIDRLARYGGHLAWGKLECNLRRSRKWKPFGCLQPIPTTTQADLCNALGPDFDYGVSSSEWTVRAKETNLGFSVLLVDTKFEHYFGFYDCVSARRIVDRLQSGHSIHLQMVCTTAFHC